MGTGGMRFSAGRPGWHVKAEHCRYIDARRWAREGLLQAGCAGSWVWTNPTTREETGSIGYSVSPGLATLVYVMGGKPMRQHVPVLTTSCNYGGQRYWFGCPRCSQRVAVLYLRNNGFGCRKCCRIAYSSQSDDEMDRTWRKQRRIERRLGENFQRPKGMHFVTYARLLDEIAKCGQERAAGFALAVAKLRLLR